MIPLRRIQSAWLIWSLVASSPLLGQQPTCHPLNRPRFLPVKNTHDTAVSAAMRDSLWLSWHSEDPDAQDDRQIERLWRQDSLALLGTLAEIITNQRAFPYRHAELASRYYHQLSGRELPLLALGTFENDMERVALMLRALRRPLSTPAEAIVLAYSCDAAWQMRAVASDSTYYNAYIYGDDIIWPRSARVAVEAGLAILSGEYLATLQRMLGDLSPNDF
jgi:hypothetical protein